MQAFELPESLDRAQRQDLSMGQSPTQLLSSTTFDPQRDVHGERPKASFSYPADCNTNHSPPSCPSIAVAHRRVNKEVVKKSGKKCSFVAVNFICDTLVLLVMLPVSAAANQDISHVCQSNTGYKSAPSKAVVSESSIEKP